MDQYCIKDDYQTNPSEQPLDLTKQVSDGIAGELQKAVYEKAAELTHNNGYDSVLDIGCGSGFKLIKYFGDKKTLGIEVAPNYEWLCKEYPERKWLYPDYSNTVSGFDLVICADVIEHVMDPDQIMSYINRAKPKCIVMSTPDRELLPAEWRRLDGPPFNHTHIREWSTREFLQYCNSWFDGYDIQSSTSPAGVTVWMTKKNS